MDSSSDQHQQQMCNQSSLENMLVCSKSQEERKQAKAPPEHALKCPRCDSNNTKFCYYNNYSLSQPRYFCKSCRRYWTKGGTLRNVPVGGGCRKNKRSSSSSKRTQDQQPFTTNPNSLISSFNSLMPYDSNDLTLALARLQKQSCVGFDEHDFSSILGNNINNPPSSTPFNNNPSSTNQGLILDSLIGSHHQNNNMYYGYGNNGDMGEVENGNGCAGEMILPYDEQMSIATTQAVTVTTMKQEMCNAREQSESRVLWGFPWQQLNGDTNMVSDIDTGRGNWNGFNSSWHGLLNSPLM